MKNYKAHNTYTSQQVNTSSPTQTVVMVYNLILSSLEEAIDAVEKNEIERRWKANKKAMDLITHMQSTLDMEKGGEVADNLFRLYTTILFALPDIDIKNSADPAYFAIRLLTPLRDAWQELNARIAAGEIDPQAEIQKALKEHQIQKAAEKTVDAPPKSEESIETKAREVSKDKSSTAPGALIGSEMASSFATSV